MMCWVSSSSPRVGSLSAISQESHQSQRSVSSKQSSCTRRAAIGLHLLLSLARPAAAWAQGQTEALWYSTPDSLSTKSFLDHAAQISIVSPQVFALNAQGVIHGKVDPRVVAAA